ncbi:MAG: tetratricopeptide repeat protein [Treponematales bacterium]
MSRYDALEKEIKGREEETQSDDGGKDHASAWEHLGDLHYEAGCCDDAPAAEKERHYDEAIKAYTEAIKLIENVKASLPDAIKQNPDFCPDTASLYEKRGKAYEAKGEIAKAMLDYKKADLASAHQLTNKIEVVRLFTLVTGAASLVSVVFEFESGGSLFKWLVSAGGLLLVVIVGILTRNSNDKNDKP